MSRLAALLLVARAGARRGAATSAAALHPDLYFRQVRAGDQIALDASELSAFARQMNNFMYLVGDRRTGDCVVVDGCWAPDELAALAAADNMTLRAAIATHYHWDHIGGAVDLGRRGGAGKVVVPGLAELLAPPHDLPAHVPHWELDAAAAQIGVAPDALRPLADGQCMAVGGFGLEFLHTPGHSPGSMCIRVSAGLRGGANATDGAANATDDAADATDDDGPEDVLLITGDTVFPGSCGRLDLPGSDARVMYDSLRRLAALPESLVIFPGHGYNGASSTIGAEKRTGLLRPMTREQWDRSMVR